MRNITPDLLQNLRTGFKTDFQRGLGAAAAKSALLATTVSSTTRLETYGFLADLPVFRKWVGEKRVMALKDKAYQLANDSYEATLGIHKDAIGDDNLGLYGPIAEGWGQESGNLKDRLLFEALRDGHTRACYDGQNFFDTDHPVGEDGAQAANMNSDTTVEAWFLLDCSKPLKPLLYQNRMSPTFNMVTDMSDSHVFKTGEYLMGGEARGAAGYTYWQLAYRSRKTLNAANFALAKAAMQAFVNDVGEPLGIKPTHIVVGVSNVAAARDLFLKQNLAGGESNIYFKDVEIVEADRLA